MIRISCIAVLLAALAPQVAAQTADFKPVTDATLANPDPADWLMLNRTFDRAAVQPARPDQQGQCRPTPHGVVARTAEWHAGINPDCLSTV